MKKKPFVVNFIAFSILSFALFACNQQTPQESNEEDVTRYAAEIEQQKTLIDSLKSELERAKAAETDAEVGLCFDSKNQLYGKIKAEEIDCMEFAQHLNWMDTVIHYFNDYSINITQSCNGPSDMEIEACNCSSNFYISTGSEELPKTYNLFRVGPYREPSNVQFMEKEQILQFNYLDKKDRPQKARVKINRYSVDVLK